jgi:hypothetical protein
MFLDFKLAVLSILRKVKINALQRKCIVCVLVDGRLATIPRPPPPLNHLKTDGLRGHACTTQAHAQHVACAVPIFSSPFLAGRQYAQKVPPPLV